MGIFNDKELHIHVHNNCCENKQLDRIEEKIDSILEILNGGEEEIKQRIMDKLNALNEDIKSTIT